MLVHAVKVVLQILEVLDLLKFVQTYMAVSCGIADIDLVHNSIHGGAGGIADSVGGH